MRLFIGVLIFLLGVLLTLIAVGIAYYALQPSSDEILNSVTFEKVDSSLGNGVTGDTLWPVAPFSTQAVIAKLENVRAFLALAEWFRFSTNPLTDPSLPFFFTLPEEAASIKTYIADQDVFPGEELVGVLLSPTHVAFKLVSTGAFFTGSDDVLNALRVFAVVVIYTVK